MTDRVVLVIGAGVAGLAAAADLTRAGRRVIVLEARDRIGGRVFSLSLPGVRRPVELGAEFIHGHSNALWPLVQQAGLAVEPVTERHEGLREGRPAPLPDVRRTLGRLLGPNPATRPDRILGEVIDERRAAGDDPRALAATIGYVEGFHAADVRRIGIRALAENEKAEDEDGEDAFLLPGGYDAVSRWLRDQCTASLLDLRLSTPVLSLRWKPGEVTAVVRTARGDTEEVAGSQAVITLPLGILKGGVDEGLIDPLPARWHEALDSLEMGASHRIVLRFDRAWWNQGSDAPISFVHGPGSAFPVWWASRPGNDHRLTGWTGGPRALALAGRPREDVIAAATDSLEAIFGPRAGEEMDRLLGAYHHDWITDPYARGAYSFGGVHAREARAVLSDPVEDTLVLSGEALAMQGRNATVHGALISGRRAAELIPARG
ncbi:MAG TPA: NAD(P)/FAD-dependent oxidoreductase [Gemmatimonadales bacterium]